MSSSEIQAASRRKFLQFLASSPLLAAGGLEAFAGDGPMPGVKLPDPLMWGPMKTDTPNQDAEASDQRLRLRAGLPSERAAGAFRLHGVGHR